MRRGWEEEGRLEEEEKKEEEEEEGGGPIRVNFWAALGRRLGTAGSLHPRLATQFLAGSKLVPNWCLW